MQLIDEIRRDSREMVVILTNGFRPEILPALPMKRRLLHRACSHLKVTGWPSHLNAVITMKVT